MPWTKPSMDPAWNTTIPKAASSTSGIGDDQTGKQFKEEVEKELKEKVGIKAKCGTHEYAWRDG